jgi:hypothetical protein
MKVDRKIMAAGAAVAVLAVGGAGLAYGLGGDSEEQLTGPSADRAGDAALEAVGGGTVTEVERDDGGGAYEVEVQRPDGSQLEVHLDGDLNAVGTEADDDSGEDDDAGENEGADDD